MKSKILNYSLLVTFICTILVPFTGVAVHKLASTLFLLLSMIHIIVNRKYMNAKRVMLAGVVVVAFISGIFAMIFETNKMLMAFHKVVSIVVVFFMAIHLFVYQKRLRK